MARAVCLFVLSQFDFNFVQIFVLSVHLGLTDVGMGKSIRAGSAEVAEYQRPAIVLTLPGGCKLTQEQYDTYQKFQVSPNVRQW